HGVASKRNVVVEVVVGRRPEILVRVRSVGDRLTLRSRRALARRAFPRAAREDDVRGEDFGAVALDPVLVLVARVAEAALHEDAGAFVEVSRQDLAALSPHDDGVPLGPLLADLVGVEIALRRREPELEDGLAALRVAELGVRAEIAKKEDAVVSVRHDLALLSGLAHGGFGGSGSRCGLSRGLRGLAVAAQRNALAFLGVCLDGL